MQQATSGTSAATNKLTKNPRNYLGILRKQKKIYALYQSWRLSNDAVIVAKCRRRVYRFDHRLNIQSPAFLSLRRVDLQKSR